MDSSKGVRSRVRSSSNSGRRMRYPWLWDVLRKFRTCPRGKTAPVPIPAPIVGVDLVSVVSVVIGADAEDEVVDEINWWINDSGRIDSRGPMVVLTHGNRSSRSRWWSCFVCDLLGLDLEISTNEGVSGRMNGKYFDMSDCCAKISEDSVSMLAITTAAEAATTAIALVAVAVAVCLKLSTVNSHCSTEDEGEEEIEAVRVVGKAAVVSRGDVLMEVGCGCGCGWGCCCWICVYVWLSCFKRILLKSWRCPINACRLLIIVATGLLERFEGVYK